MVTNSTNTPYINRYTNKSSNTLCEGQRVNQLHHSAVNAKDYRFAASSLASAPLTTLEMQEDLRTQDCDVAERMKNEQVIVAADEMTRPTAHG